MPIELTGVLEEMAEAIGRDGALLVAAAYGGARLYVPSRCSDDHPLIEIVGRERADALCETFRTGVGGAWLEVPHGPFSQEHFTRAQMAMMLSADVPTDVIARALRVSRSSVRRMQATVVRKKATRLAADTVAKSRN